MSESDSEKRVGYVLKRAQHALRTTMDSELGETGLTTSQYAALSALEGDEGLANAALARKCFVTPQTMYRIVRGLREDGLVEQSAHPTHGRKKQLHLTDDARELLDRAHRVVGRVEEQMTSDLDARERAELVRMLEACLSGLGS